MLARENIRLLRSENPYRNGLQDLNKKEKKRESNEKVNENKKYKKPCHLDNGRNCETEFSLHYRRADGDVD